MFDKEGKMILLYTVMLIQTELQYLDVLHGRLLGSHFNFHWQLGGHDNHQPCSSNDVSHCSSSQVCTELDSAVSSVPQVKNRLFPTKASASVQALKVCQLGQDVCSAGNTFEKDS